MRLVTGSNCFGESGTIKYSKLSDLLDESQQLMAIFITILKSAKKSPR